VPVPHPKQFFRLRRAFACGGLAACPTTIKKQNLDVLMFLLNRINYGCAKRLNNEHGEDDVRRQIIVFSQRPTGILN
jgi:hypothetical protein